MTLILRMSEAKPDQKAIRKAAKIIRGGGIVIFPTETVYGIGANAFDEKACKKIYELKGRPSDNPMIVHVSNLTMAKDISDMPDQYAKPMGRVWPGPLTIVVPAKDSLSKVVTGGLDTVAIRVPANNVALELIRESGVPIAAPSANISTKPSSTKAEHAIKYFDGKVDAIIASDPSRDGIESTILDLRTFRLLRPGAFPAERIAREFRRKPIVSDATRGFRYAKKATAPGMKYKHYSPSTPMFLYTGNPRHLPSILDGIDLNCVFMGFDQSCRAVKGKCPTVSLGPKGDLASVAHNLFDALIDIDALGADFGIIENFSEKGIGLGVMNRIRKASANRSFSDRKGLDELIIKTGTMPLRATLGHIIDGERILLKLASRGISKGKWNGPGGKIDPGETPEECVIRETKEETGLSMHTPFYHGRAYFHMGGAKPVSIIAHIFSAYKFSGRLRPSEEGDVRWFDISQIPYKKMWDDDKYWLKLMLSGKRFDMHFYYDKGNRKVIRSDIKLR